jgi:threonine/homoserine/homoserine lactone efflux protein
MIPLALYLAFLAASVLLLLTPGPNVALIVSASLARGRVHGLVTVAGTSAAMVLQLGVTVFGMAALLTNSANLFAWVRWIGVAYLIFLGLRVLFAAGSDDARAPAHARSYKRSFATGFLVSLTNPKTLLFYGAFLPQFVSPGAPALPQLVTLAASFLALALCLDGSWALLAARMAPLIGRPKLRKRIEGTLLMAAGVGVAVARKS